MLTFKTSMIVPYHIHTIIISGSFTLLAEITTSHSTVFSELIYHNCEIDTTVHNAKRQITSAEY